MNLQEGNAICQLTEGELDAVTGGAVWQWIAGYLAGKVLDNAFGGKPVSIQETMAWYRANAS